MVLYFGVKFNFLVLSVKRCWFEWKVKLIWDIILFFNWNLLIKININLNRFVVYWKIVRYMGDGGSWYLSYGWFYIGKIRLFSNKLIIVEVIILVVVIILFVIIFVGNDYFMVFYWNICLKVVCLLEYWF